MLRAANVSVGVDGGCGGVQAEAADTARQEDADRRYQHEETKLQELLEEMRGELVREQQQLAWDRKELAAERGAVHAQHEQLLAARAHTAVYAHELEATARLVQVRFFHFLPLPDPLGSPIPPTDARRGKGDACRRTGNS